MPLNAFLIVLPKLYHGTNQTKKVHYLLILFSLNLQERATEPMANGRAGSMEAGHGQTTGLNGSSRSIAAMQSIAAMPMRPYTDHFSPSSVSMPPMGPTIASIRREPFEALLRGDDSLANKVQTVIISRKYMFASCYC